MKAKLHEIEVYEAVKMGLLEIRTDGTIWKVAELRGNRWNLRQTLRRIAPRRAEHDQGLYFQVRRMTGAQRKYCLAHRLVWLHFHGPIAPNLQINHINGIKKDNRPENLEVVTASENIRHAVRVLRTGRTARQWGQSNLSSKLTDAQIEAIRTIYAAGSLTQQQVANQFGVTFQTISKIVRNERRPKQSGPTADYTNRHNNPNASRNNKGQFHSA